MTCLSGRQASAIGDAEDVRIDGNGGLSEGSIEDDVRRLAADAGQRLERFPIVAARRPPWRSISNRQVARMFFALVLKSPIVRMQRVSSLEAEVEHLLVAWLPTRTARASPD